MTEVEERLRGVAVEGDDAVPLVVAQFVRRADDEGLVEVATAPIDTPVGTLRLAATPIGLVFVALHADDGVDEHLARTISPRVVEHPARLDAVRRQLDEYFAGDRVAFDVPIDWRLSSGFRRTVLERLYHDVGFGHVVSYRELAERVGNPKASRAVGSAMATNPVPIIVPCHRVLRSGGALGGYGGGLDMKRALLTLEGSLLA
ncbi:MAG: methylated-DNA--[protein]-cysteine S-methyltransferase [Acidimicrobiales bacterium]